MQSYENRDKQAGFFSSQVPPAMAFFSILLDTPWHLGERHIKWKLFEERGAVSQLKPVICVSLSAEFILASIG